jgi:hypothetical protein
MVSPYGELTALALALALEEWKIFFYVDWKKWKMVGKVASIDRVVP